MNGTDRRHAHTHTRQDDVLKPREQVMAKAASKLCCKCGCRLGLSPHLLSSSASSAFVARRSSQSPTTSSASPAPADLIVAFDVAVVVLNENGVRCSRSRPPESPLCVLQAASLSFPGCGQQALLCPCAPREESGQRAAEPGRLPQPMALRASLPRLKGSGMTRIQGSYREAAGGSARRPGA